MASNVQKLLQNFDGRADFRAGLIEMQIAFRESGQFLNAFRTGQVLRRKSLFEKLYTQSMERAASDLLASPRASEFGDGEFAKWLIEWFSNGGWEIILEFIKGLLPLFGLISLVPFFIAILVI